MYMYNMHSLSDSAVRAAMNNLMKEYSEEDAREMLVQKYPYLEGEIMSLDLTAPAKPYVTNSGGEAEPAPVFLEADDEETETAVSSEPEIPVVEAEAVVEVAAAEPTKESKEVKKARTSRGDSKMATAKQIYQEMKGSARKDVVKKIVDATGMPSNQAGVYYYNCKKFFENNPA